MNHSHKDRATGLRMPRSRGAVSGLLLVILGAWGALIPFVGPHFNFAYTPDQDWAWTTARGWLEVFPGVATVVGGLLLILSGNRAVAMFGGWLAVLGGAWFVVGGQFAPLLRIGSVGDPIATTERKRAVLEVTYFSGLGALIVFLGGIALARLAVRLARDVVPRRPAWRLARPANRRLCRRYRCPPAVRLSGERVVARDRRHQAAGGALTAAAGGAARAVAVALGAPRARTCGKTPRADAKAPDTPSVRGLLRLLALHQSRPSSRRSLTYLAMICGEMCGMSLSGPTFASWTAARNRSVGAIEPLIGLSGFW